jgi:hypothetical protein
MADKKISELTTITTVDNAADLFPIVDTSAAETKKITPTALKTALALNNVDNTSDANKAISSATQSALDAKQATLVSGTNIKTINSTSILGSGNISISSAVAWGGITGTLSTQTDLQTALDLKVDENTAITGATKTKITYDAKGLVTAGADATTADIADSTNKRYVTDAQSTVIGNTSGTNTGDNATNSQYSGLAASKQDALGFTPENVANKSTSVTTDQASNTKYPSVKAVYDWAVGLFATISQLTAKQDTLVSGTNIKTIEGQSLLGSGNIDLAKSDVGLGNVDNTSDANKPVSTAQQTALDTKTNKLIVANRQTASYTLVLSDADKLVEMNVGSANNLTVPASVFAAGNQILLAQYGAGQTTIVAGSGMTIRSNGGKLKLNTQYSGATLVFISSSEAYLFGDIA